MVTSLVLGWFASAAAAVIGVLPHPALPSWLTAGVPSWFVTGLAFPAQLGGWFPLVAIGQAVGFLVLCWTSAIAIRIGRIALSLLGGAGGA